MLRLPYLIATLFFRKERVQPIVNKNLIKGGMMASLQEAVTEKFIETLAGDQTFDQAKVAKLEALLKADGKIKVDDLTAIFALPEGGEVL